MDCADLAPLLSAYADGEIVDGDRSEVEAHLSGCESCTAEVQGQIQFKQLLQTKLSASSPRAPALLRARIQRDLAEKHAAEQARRYTAYLGVAAGLLVVASGGYVLSGAQSESSRSDSLLAEAVDKHARALPVEVTPAGGDVDGWFRGKVDFNVQVPRFRSAGAPQLVGARLANVRDRQAAYVVYGSDQAARRMTLLVYPGDGVELPTGRRAQVNGRDVVLANQRGYNVALWNRRGITYSLISDLDEHDVLQLVSEVEER